MKVKTNNTAILIYHSVGGFHKEMLDLNIFRHQLKLIKQRSYEVIPLAALVENIMGKRVKLKKNLCLTFDDGYEDFFYNAWPLLKDYGFSATCFLTVSDINKDGYLKDHQIEEMLDSNLLTIGSHAMSHRHFLDLRPEELNYEINESKRILQARFGIAVDFFAYPYGSFNLFIENMVESAGYRAAFSTNQELRNRRGQDDLFALKRLSVLRDYNPLRFLIKTSGLGYYFSRKL